MTREEVLKICEEAREKGERADLRGAGLIVANLIGANLTHAELAHANLRHANLRHADLTRANLRHANLRHADLTRANMVCADLTCADLDGANLTHADLTLANITDRIIQIGPIGSRKDYICYNATLDEMRCGCFFGTLTDFEEQVRKNHRTTKHAREYLAMVRFLEEMREINKTAEEAEAYA